MMRIRMPNGITNAAQLRAISELSRECGTGFVDITTRQQIQLRGFAIGDVPHIWERLRAVELVSLQTGMDNIRNVVGCPVAGIGRRRVVRRVAGRQGVHRGFLKNKAFTNLPRKFNVAITACTANCTHAETQDLALTPAIKIVDGEGDQGLQRLGRRQGGLGRPSARLAARRVRRGPRVQRRCAATSRCSFAITGRAARAIGRGWRFSSMRGASSASARSWNVESAID